MTGYCTNPFSIFVWFHYRIFFVFLLRPSFDMVFAKEGDLRGCLFLLFRFFSGGGCGSCKSSYIKSGGKFSRYAKKFFYRLFLGRGVFFFGDTFCDRFLVLASLLLFYEVPCFPQFRYRCTFLTELLLLFYCLGRCFLSSMS